MENKNFAIRVRRQLLSEYHAKIRNGLYAMTSQMMAYNSNKIEGSTLTPEQTASLFDTGDLYADAGTIYRAKDIEEMNGHFYMFNHALETLDRPLSEDLVKEFHYCLKNGVFEDRANGYVAGEYKKRANIVSDVHTALPSEVPEKMRVLLHRYHEFSRHNLEDLLRFHAEYEHIHPFQDGNGRTGRMILFRECLVNQIVPVIIQDKTKAEYYHGLHEAQTIGSIDALTVYANKQQELYYRDAIIFIAPDLTI